jgi:hypothetical protein
VPLGEAAAKRRPESLTRFRASGIRLTRVAAIDELTEALTEAGLKWGRPRAHGSPEIRVKNDAGREFLVKVLRFSFIVCPSESQVVYQRLSVADVLEMVRG